MAVARKSPFPRAPRLGASSCARAGWAAARRRRGAAAAAEGHDAARHAGAGATVRAEKERVEENDGHKKGKMDFLRRHPPWCHGAMPHAAPSSVDAGAKGGTAHRAVIARDNAPHHSRTTHAAMRCHTRTRRDNEAHNTT
jgi:hypothetical protein